MVLTRIPGIPYAAAPRAEGYAVALAQPPRLVVIHDTGNPNSRKEGEASYAHTRTDARDRWTSAHAYVDDAGVLGSLRLDRQAWAAFAYANAHGVHLELCLTGNRATTRRIAAELTRQICDLFGIPKVKLAPAQVAAGARGVCGHRDVTIGLGVGDHTDPEADFPWGEFMSVVNGNGGGGTATSGGSTVSTRSDAVIEAWAVGNSHAAGGDVEPVKWRVLDEQWQRSTDAKLAAVTTALSDLKTALGALGTAGPGTGGGADAALSDADVQRIAKAVADEQYRRQAE